MCVSWCWVIEALAASEAIANRASQTPTQPINTKKNHKHAPQWVEKVNQKPFWLYPLWFTVTLGSNHMWHFLKMLGEKNHAIDTMLRLVSQKSNRVNQLTTNSRMVLMQINILRIVCNFNGKDLKSKSMIKLDAQIQILCDRQNTLWRRRKQAILNLILKPIGLDLNAVLE